MIHRRYATRVLVHGEQSSEDRFWFRRRAERFAQRYVSFMLNVSRLTEMRVEVRCDQRVIRAWEW